MYFLKYVLVGFLASIVGGLVSLASGVDEYSWLGWTIDLVVLLTALTVTIAFENVGKKRLQQNNSAASTEGEVSNNPDKQDAS
jgi:cbb3-type cytochrome oxidase subunit 1